MTTASDIGFVDNYRAGFPTSGWRGRQAPAVRPPGTGRLPLYFQTADDLGGHVPDTAPVVRCHAYKMRAGQGGVRGNRREGFGP